MSGEVEARSLEFTPTWALATVVSALVLLSLLFVFGIEKIEHKLKCDHRKPLVRALHKMKEELMLLGFISILLEVFSPQVAGICIKSTVLDHWTVCGLHHRRDGTSVDESQAPAGEHSQGGERRLLSSSAVDWKSFSYEPWPVFHGRLMAENASESNPSSCEKGYEPFMTEISQAQLNTFIFVLAVVHLFYTFVAIGLSIWRVSHWKSWEENAHVETSLDVDTNSASLESIEVRNLLKRYPSTFIRQHTSNRWSRSPLAVWIVCFFRQFIPWRSVTHADYVSLRQGFIEYHNTGQNFNFHKYVTRSMEDDFHIVVGISPLLWIFVLLFLLFNVNGTNLYFWISLVPLLLVVLVGTKLQHVIVTLAFESAENTIHGHSEAASLVMKPRDGLFWFGKPKLLLKMVHFMIFQNSFEHATFIWIWWRFSLDSCMLENMGYVYVRLALGVLVQIMCSYSTLPLYALVSQMGTRHKAAIFTDRIHDKIHKWKRGATNRLHPNK